MKKIKTKDLTLMSLFTALICVSAYISVPLPFSSSPLTLMNFTILLASLIFPLKEALMIIITWLLLGSIGLPVFAAGGAGIGFIISPKVGYYLGFLLSAIFIGITKGKKYSRIRYTVISIISVIIVNLCGTVILSLSSLGSENALSLKNYLIAGFLAFIPLDIIKAVIAAQITPKVKQLKEYE